MKTPSPLRRLAWPALLALAAATGLRAQIPTVLTDKIYRGSGVIDLMKNASGTQLSQYLGANGRLLLGVDVNEDAAGNESNKSQGIAIKNVQLLITTNKGSFSFSDIFTNTTALLTEAGSTTAKTYNTLFGQGGSSQITGSTTGFDLSKFDDVLEVRDVAVAGTITSAKLVVNFLETGSGKGAGANESFFDFSGGFEDFALLAPKDAQILEAAALGTSDLTGTVSYSSTTVNSTYYIQPSATATEPTTTTTPTPTTQTTTTSTTTVSTTTTPTSTVATTTTPTTTTTSQTTADPTTTVSTTTTPTSTVATTTTPTTTTPTTTTFASTSPTTSVALAAPGAPEPPLVLLCGGAFLALLAAARERLVRRA